jgi:formylglycine-generating enzyme required for sulfatase activity
MFNSANYDEIANSTTIVGTNGGPSYYGTYDQCGNVYEWTEGNGPDVITNDVVSKTKSARGGRYLGRNGDLGLKADYLHYFVPQLKGIAVGFRVCSQGFGNIQNSGLLVPNPLANPLNFSSFVFVTDIGNEADILDPIGIRYKNGNPNLVLEINTNRFGAVDYDYLIQKYPVTVEEYCEFLNAVAVEDTYNIFSTALIVGIDPLIEILENSIYRPIKGKARKPISHANWYDAARFVNWLCNGKRSGKQDKTTTEDGAYTLNGVTRPENNTSIKRNVINPNTGLPPTYWLPNEDEWHKAAYYKGGGKDAGYWTFATQSEVSPLSCTKDLFHNGSAATPIPYHEHDIRDIKNIDGKTDNITFIDNNFNKIVLEFRDGLLINYSKTREKQ